MAADNRPYKSKEQDGQGNEIIIRDQQLVEQGTATTMASGACFETFDVDNRPVKIPRDNMMSIVLECIGIIVNDSSKNLGTNVQKALGLQGNLIGNVTVSDLASVLGVPGNSIKCRYVFSSVGEEKIIATLSEGKASGSFFAYTQTGYTNETLWFVVYSDDIKVFCLAGGNPNANCELLISNKSIIMKNKITGGIPLSYFNVSNFTINNVYE